MNGINYTITALVLSITLPASAYAVSVSNNAQGYADIDAGISGNVNVNLGADATTSTDSANVVVGIPQSLEVIVVTRADVEGSGAISASASPASVSSETDLSGFVAAQIATDENLSKVESSKGRVSVTYPQKAKLVGFIPVTVNATATVLADGTVDVKYPWYAFLMVTNEADLEAAIKGEVSTLSSSSVNATADAELELTARAQAELIDEVRAVMESQLAIGAGGTAEL